MGCLVLLLGICVWSRHHPLYRSASSRAHWESTDTRRICPLATLICCDVPAWTLSKDPVSDSTFDRSSGNGFVDGSISSLSSDREQPSMSSLEWARAASSLSTRWCCFLWCRLFLAWELWDFRFGGFLALLSLGRFARKSGLATMRTGVLPIRALNDKYVVPFRAVSESRGLVTSWNYDIQITRQIIAPMYDHF